MMNIYRYGETPLSSLLIRTVEKSGVTDAVRRIIEDVEARGDEALLERLKKVRTRLAAKQKIASCSN